MTQVTSAHLGESLGTDFFSVREQFTDEQWEHFVTVRRFVDEEVVPVVGPYWERAEICWPLVKRLPELGIVGEDIQGYGCAGMSPMACGLSPWNCTAATAASACSSACTRAWP
jgi:glutaryl-CoA dehydrogenase